jgi:hypothetical protein
MGKRRMIDMDGLVFDDELGLELGLDGLFLYIRLWSIAEDWGGLSLSPHWIICQMGMIQDSYSLMRIEEIVDKLIKLGKIIPYQHNNRHYGFLKNFSKYQTINFPDAPKLPLPSWVKWHPGNGKTTRQRYETLASNSMERNDKLHGDNRETVSIFVNGSAEGSNRIEINKNNLSSDSENIRKGDDSSHSGSIDNKNFNFLVKEKTEFRKKEIQSMIGQALSQTPGDISLQEEKQAEMSLERIRAKNLDKYGKSFY